MKVTIPYKPREEQRELHKDKKRWRVTICHRRFGKTVYAINRLLKDCLTCENNNPRFAYIAPYRMQAKQIAWDYLKYYSRAIPGIEVYESELRIDFPNGGRVRLFGADNPDALRGIYLDGVVLDEYAQINPQLFPEVIRPALAEREGWCEFMGTPAGRNHLHDLYQMARDDPDWSLSVFKASETGILPSGELEAAHKQMSDDTYQQEFECSFTAAMQGSYYHKLIERAREEGRIGKVPVAAGVSVNTFWDLGWNDTNAIWFHQRVGKEDRFVDYYENYGEGLEHYVRVLRDRDYLYGEHYLPHDAEQHSLQTAKSPRKALEEMGVKPCVVVPRVREISHGIELARQVIPTSWFDEERCAIGIRALENYRKAYDEKTQSFRDRPLHDWASNGADAYRMFAQGFKERVKVEWSEDHRESVRGSQGWMM